MRLRGLLLAWLVVTTTQSHAAIQTLAITGASAPQIPDAEFSVGDGVFSLARLSNNGSVAFSAMLSQSSPNVNNENDYIVFRHADNAFQVIAREGSGDVPNVPGASFAGFSNFGIDNDGSIFTRGTLVTNVGGVTSANNQGFWKFTSTAGLEIARTMSANAPGFNNTRFDSLGFALRPSSSGVLAFDARLKSEGGATSANDYGVWQDDVSGGSIVAREGQPSPGVVAIFDAFGAPVASNSGHVAFRGQLKLGGAITTTNRIGVWNYQSGVGSLVARTGSGGVPDLPGANFTAFDDPLMNSVGQLVLPATLNTGNAGLWRYDGTTGKMLAMAGGAAPEVPDTTFFEVKWPVLSDNGQVVARGHMNAGPGVDLLNDTGLWAFDEVLGNRLLARTGIEGMVPGKLESTFANLGRYAANDLGDVLLQAELNEPFEDLGHQGIWLYPYDGVPQLLLQSGDEVAGRTIERLKFLTHDDTRDSVTNVFNNSGQFVFQAEFTNGDFGLFLYSPEATTTYAAADFNIDGYVDNVDLEYWTNAFGETAVGDADDDGDTDGRDLIIWQRQFTGPPAHPPVAVPEPTVWCFVAFIFGFAQHRSSFAAVRCV
jgi:hypothetical protein